MGWIKTHQYLIILQSVTFTSTPLPYIYDQDILGHIRTTVTDNMRIIGKSDNWAELCFLESLNIKWKNTGIKATKELVLFS